jgi:N6-adenosine-specific RNA methylase IME4
MNNRRVLVRYDAACRAIAHAKRIDEAKNIRDVAIAMAVYARQAKNKDLEADAVEIRMRATRRLDQIRQAQKESVGLATGGEHGGRRRKDGVRNTPSISRPTLASQGVDQNLAKQARILGALSDKKFEQAVADARDEVMGSLRRIISTVTIEQERANYRRRTKDGGTAADLDALAASGKKFAVILGDPPYTFRTYSSRSEQRSPKRHYDVMSLDQIKALPVPTLAAKHCALFLWCVNAELPGALELIRSWGFEYSTVGFAWVKINPSGEGLAWGMGWHTRSNIELCLLALRGTPARLAKDVHQIVMAPVGEHSEKPEEIRRRIERLYPGPYLELFARQPRMGWTTWGNEVAAQPSSKAHRRLDNERNRNRDLDHDRAGAA